MVITPKEGLKLNSFYLLATAWLSLTPNLAWANTGLPLSFALVCALGIVRLKRK
jgi:predicted signal transduction protein with EAL and GGDEF domain